MFKSLNSYNRVSVFAYLSETIFRGSLATAAFIAAIIISPAEIGKATLAGSIGLIFSGLSNANWASRMQMKSRYFIDFKSAFKEYLALLATTLAFFTALYFFLSSKHLISLSILIFVSVITYLLANLNEILWGIIGIYGLSPKILVFRFYGIVIGACSGMLILLKFQNSFSMLFVQFAIWGIILVVQLITIRPIFSKIAPTSNVIETRFLSLDTLKILSTNLVINFSMVADNLILIHFRNTNELAKYSLAFGACSLFVSIISSTYQRLYSVKKNNFKVQTQFRRNFYIAIPLFFILVTLSYITRLNSNIILRESPRIIILLIPSIFLRIQTSKYSAVLTRFGENRINLYNSLITVLLLGFFGIPLSNYFGAYGMAASTSITYSLLCAYLKRRTQKLMTSQL